MRLASSPDIPTASGPCTLMAETMSRFTLPTSTMRAMSSVSASVTRSPLRNSVSLPSRSIKLADLGAAAVHHDGEHADGAHEDHVLGERGQRVTGRLASAPSAACRALPPYLTTTIFSQKRRMYGSASTRTEAVFAAAAFCGPGDLGRHRSGPRGRRHDVVRFSSM